MGLRSLAWQTVSAAGPSTAKSPVASLAGYVQVDRAFGLLPKIVPAQALVLEHIGMVGARALLECSRPREEDLGPADGIRLPQVVPHMLQQHGRFFETADDLPQHLARRFHHPFQQRAIAIRMAGMAAEPRHLAFHYAH